MPGAADVLAALRVPACIATSSGTERATRSLAIAGFGNGNGKRRKLFTGSMVKRGKPAPDLFLLAANSHAGAAGGMPCRRGQRHGRAGGAGGRHAGLALHRRQPLRRRLPHGSPQTARADRELSSMALFFRGSKGWAVIG